jgi:hypothetical protein
MIEFFSKKALFAHSSDPRSRSKAAAHAPKEASVPYRFCPAAM